MASIIRFSLYGVVDLNPKAAMFVIFIQLTEIGMGSGIGGQALIELGNRD